MDASNFLYGKKSLIEPLNMLVIYPNYISYFTAYEGVKLSE